MEHRSHLAHFFFFFVHYLICFSWEMSASMRTATSSLSYSNSRREWDFEGRSKNRTLARNLPYTRQLADFSPIVHRACIVSQPSNAGSLRASANISEYDNVEETKDLCKSKSEEEFTALINGKPLESADLEPETSFETFPNNTETCPFKCHKESIRRSMMKSKIHKKLDSKQVDLVVDVAV